MIVEQHQQLLLRPALGAVDRRNHTRVHATGGANFHGLDRHRLLCRNARRARLMQELQRAVGWLGHLVQIHQTKSAMEAQIVGGEAGLFENVREDPVGEDVRVSIGKIYCAQHKGGLVHAIMVKSAAGVSLGDVRRMREYQN